MIKFAVRRNLIYPLQLLLWNFLRDTESSLISYFFNLNDLLIYTPLMFFGEILAGSILYRYQKKFLSENKKEEKIFFMNIEYIQTEIHFKEKLDKKAFFLLFVSAFFDFVYFVLFLQVSKYITLSGSFEQRLRGTITIINALFYFYALGLPLFKHNLFALICIGICVIIVIITELIFQEFNIFLSYGQFFLILFFIFIIHLSSALEESIEKYLFECNQLNSFFVLMFQGVFGFILTVIYCLFHSPFDDIIKFKQNSSTLNFVILIFALILYIILSGGKNSFRLLTTKIFSPMTTTFLDYILNPFYIIYYFISRNDFISYGKINVAYFVINVILSLIITFCGCIYNEFLILFCCGLERDTHNQVTTRSRIEHELDSLLSEDDPDIE